MIRVLVVDDQELVRSGLVLLLSVQDGIEVVGEAHDGLAAVAAAQRLAPDVVLMDVRMPGMGGIEATAEIVDGPHSPRVLVLTTFDLDEHVYAALRAGASGFLLKEASAAELVHGISVVAAGEALLAPTATRRLVADVVRRRGAVAPVPALDTLTEREREVLVLLARGLSNAEVAERLYLGEATVKTHVGNVLVKLSLRDRVQAVVLAYEAGIVVPGIS